MRFSVAYVSDILERCSLLLTTLASYHQRTRRSRLYHQPLPPKAAGKAPNCIPTQQTIHLSVSALTGGWMDKLVHGEDRFGTYMQRSLAMGVRVSHRRAAFSKQRLYTLDIT